MTATASIESWWAAPTLRRAVRPGPSSETTTDSRPRFAQHCIKEFEWLAQHDPAELARLALSDLTNDQVLLSQAAEAMALSHHHSIIEPVLLRLLKHQRPFVREAALVGLSAVLASSLHARDQVRAMASHDSSPGVREAAAEALSLL